MKIKFIIFCFVLLIFGGCAYVNTLYNGGYAYKKAQRLQKQYERMSKDSLDIARETGSFYKRSVTKADKVLLEYPKSEKSHDAAYFLKGISLFELNEYMSAMNIFEVLLEYYPESKYEPRTLLYLARTYAKIEDFVAAENYVEMLLEKYPQMQSNSELIFLQADLAVQLEGKSAAIEVLEKRLAETADPFHKLSIIERLMALTMENQDYEKALSYTASMPSFNKKYSSIYYRVEFRKLQCLRKLLESEEAIKFADLMLSNSSYLYNRTEIMLEKGISFIDMGKYDEAIRILKDIVFGAGSAKIRCKAWFEYAGVSIDIKNELDSGRVQLDSALFWVGDDKEMRLLIKKRLDGLKKIDELQKTLEDADPFTKVDSTYYQYRIGEEYWLSAQIPDSALNYFNMLIESIQTPDSIRAKSLYSTAYILKEIKKDTVSSDSIFSEIINKYPSFEVAKASQNMLGIPVTLMTRRDSATIQLAIAEKMEEENDFSYSQEAYYAYLLCALKYPDIKDIAAKSLYAAGWVANKRNNIVDGIVDTAVVKIYVRLCNDYPESEQCLNVKYMMDIGEVKSYAVQYSSRIEKSDSSEIQMDGTQSEISVEKRKAVLPDFQSWI
ncbi:MAG: tetratricopeptide repeat protein [Chitinispirillales bacterium]|jgi:tetratricopeptide (TPR) repeat protein|nr:tetratricopeptide repeat protein [Chitinispirillales bacterium]